MEALARLHHPGLVTLHDGGTEPGPDGRTYVVTDLVDGPHAGDAHAARAAARSREIRKLAAALAAALAHVHARGFVHRDVKPANILLDHGREPRLADFGIARALDGTVATATGAVAGTAAYLAPEQVRGETVGPAADVYALGLVLIEARTGRREYPGAMVESATARPLPQARGAARAAPGPRRAAVRDDRPRPGRPADRGRRRRHAPGQAPPAQAAGGPRARRGRAARPRAGRDLPHRGRARAAADRRGRPRADGPGRLNPTTNGETVGVSTDTPADSPLVAGRYRLDRIVGAGGAAIVHEGCDLDTGERVAVKVYRSDGSGHPTQHHRELKALTSLRHPGLVALLDGGTEPGPDGRTYVVTDLVEGPSLARRLDAGPLSADEVRVLAIGLGEALAHVHAHGFVHRDVKPANILLEHGHKPRLADFGIARALDGTVYTATGAVAGTAAYLAPEQVRGETVDPSVDVFALGLVLIEALTGEREYPGTLAESAAARLHRRPVVPAGLPSDLAAVLAAMTDPDPALRPSAAAVATGLRTRTVERPARARRRAWGWGARTALAAAVLLVALLGGAVLLFGRTAASGPLVPVPNIAAPEAAAGVVRVRPGSGRGRSGRAGGTPRRRARGRRSARRGHRPGRRRPRSGPRRRSAPGRADRPRAAAPAPPPPPRGRQAPSPRHRPQASPLRRPRARARARTRGTTTTAADGNKGNGGGNGNSDKGQGSQGQE